jgi:hypothetical protein
VLRLKHVLLAHLGLERGGARSGAA